MQDVENVFDTSLTIGSETPQVRTTDHHRLCAHRNGLHNIATATNTTVEHNIDVVTDCSNNCREHTNWRWCSVEVVAAMV